MKDALTSALTNIANFVPKLALFLVILVVGYLIAKVLRKAVNAVLERVGFDNAVERGGVGRALERSKYDASDILAKLVYYAVLLFTLQLAFSAFGPNPISDLIERIIVFLPAVFTAIVIVVVAAAIGAAVRELIVGTLGGLSYGKLLGNIASVFIIGLGIIAALGQIGVATTVTTPVLVAVLATIAGVIIVGAGGGLVRPMQGRWERWLDSAERETGAMREQVRQAPSVKEQAMQAKERYSDAGSGQTRTQAQTTSGPRTSTGSTSYGATDDGLYQR
jgi:mechanosensitive ion channel-like protein